MSAYQCWLTQRERLREHLRNAGDASAAYLTRHAIAQVEQNVMAEQPDDLLRQQTGILFACVKTSLGFLEISVDTKVWLAKDETARARKRGGIGWMLPACAVEAALAAFGAVTGQPLFWIPACVALTGIAAGWIGLSRERRHESPPEDRLRVTASPNAEKLFQSIDAQMKALDRYINDFQYLNEQAAAAGQSTEGRNAGLYAELMQAAYACEDEAREEIAAAAKGLLAANGITAVEYSAENARYFNLLPSHTETGTISPALLSLKDGALLNRGTAVILEPSQSAGDGVGTPARGADQRASDFRADPS
ncbi:MAG: hypothetical protein GX418_06155 [Clostridiales bacterium]|nr:hypothetical protein [Clostridiales bacterium]